ncbi:MAG: CBS domain-containing protein [Desulfobacterales bacterium]|nr:CBS domain-containing protein [Desulfobacterales bacterium]
MKNLPLDPCPVNISDEDIFEAMKEIRRVPVTTSDGRLKGIISRVDLIQSFCSLEA